MVEAVRGDGNPHRISFAYSHRDQPKRSSNGYVGRFSVPFDNTIKKIFQADTNLPLFANRIGGVGYWRSIQSEAEFQTIQNWVQHQGTRIFLRDCLDLSIALDQNLQDNQSGKYTDLGNLENSAKTDQNPIAIAIAKLVECYVAAIQDLPYYRDANFVAAVPPRPGKPFDLPTELTKRIALELGKTDLTHCFKFGTEKGTVKDLPVDEKWEAWEKNQSVV